MADEPMTPPMIEDAGTAPAMQCSRWLGDRNCGAEAKFHVIWTLHMDNGLVCDEHAAEARRRWVFIGFHPYEMTCSRPRALWLADRDVCVLPGDERLLARAGAAGGETP